MLIMFALWKNVKASQNFYQSHDYSNILQAAESENTKSTGKAALSGSAKLNRSYETMNNKLSMVVDNSIYPYDLEGVPIPGNKINSRTIYSYWKWFINF